MQTDFSKSNTFHSSASTDKYRGMIEKSFYKKTRDNLFQLFGYVYSISPEFYSVHAFISIWRMFQIAFFAFAPSFPVWKDGTFAQKFVDVLSIFSFFIPKEAYEDSMVPFLLVYSIIFSGFVTFLSILSYYFASKATLPAYMPSFIVLFCSTAGYILHAPAINFLGLYIGKVATGQTTDSLIFSLFIILFAMISYTLFILYLKNIISVSATFRPDSLMCISHITSVSILGTPTTGILIIAIGSQLPLIGRIVTECLTIIIYIYLLISVLTGGLLNINYSASILSSALTGSLMIILIMVEDIIGMYAFSLQPILYIIVFTIFFYVFKFFLNYKKNVNIAILDMFNEDEETFDYVKSVKQYVSIAYDGFSIGHPICLNWAFCQTAIAKWPDNIECWYTYLKFVAIYPEETRLLSSIGHSIMQNKLKGSLAKQSIEQVSTLLRQRESNLSVVLKGKLLSVSKLVQSAKHKLRYVWDMAIQGNTAEMENAILRTYQSVQKCNSQYKHLLMQYPNNRFLTRSYSRFLLEVVADTRNFEIYDNQTKLLQRGVYATEDQAHALGLHTFPALPTHLHEKMTSQSVTGTIDDNFSNCSTIDGDSSMNELATTIAQNVDDIVFPTFSALCPARLIMATLFFIIPITSFSIYAFVQIGDMRRPLDYIYALSNEELLFYMLPTMSQRYVLECSSILPKIDRPGMGGFNKTADQLVYVVNSSVIITEMIKILQNNDINTIYLDDARKALFTDKFKYIKFKDSVPQETYVTANAIIVDYAIMASRIVANPSATIGMDEVKTLVENKDRAVQQVLLAIENVQKYITYRKVSTETLINYANIVIDILFGSIWVITISVMVHYVRREKEEVFLCLTSLQKNVVSAILDKLKLIKKADQVSSTQNSESDLNKQEENMLKIFTTANDDNRVISIFNLANVGSTIIQLIIYLIASYLITLMFSEQLDVSIEESPHFSQTFESYAYQIAIISNVLTLKENDASLNATEVFDTIENLAKKVSESFYSLQYGCGDHVPFEMVIDSIYVPIVGKVSSALHYLLTSTNVNEIIAKFRKDKGHDAVSTETVERIWTLTNDILYPKFYQEIFGNMLDHAKSLLNPNRTPYFAVSIALGIVIICTELFIVWYNLKEQNMLKFTLRLLQHCPPHVIQQSSRIMSVLSGNFSNKKLDKTLRGTDYFMEIIKNVPDGIIITNHDSVTLMNKTACRIFNTENYQGKRMEEIIGDKNPEFTTQFNSLIENTPNVSVNYVLDESTTFNLEMSLLVIKDDRIYILKDTTQYKRYNTLIAEERMKSDMLLASILPAKLVGRVQAGEKDISFEVQSASVIFMDIVEFTPWCASLNASDVMMTLNRLFTEFDKLVAATQTITRIKCIGDCYMAAGGILSDVNIPDLHAKEAVQFGLDSIDAVQRVNGEINQNLRIRVGVNTGGPLVAGVIGVGKPTFEIIGPVINMAQQMEHHGVPMNVHISRAVYELIYGGTFNIKERGQIEIKGGMAVTYLVTK